MNYKKVINILFRCGLYVFIISRMFNLNLETNIIFNLAALKVVFDFFLLSLLFFWKTTPFSDLSFNSICNVIMYCNLLFFSYFYAKICGVYKLFKDFRFWKKQLIFLLIAVLILPVSMFDFKNLEIFNDYFKNESYFEITTVAFFVLLAFYLNIFFNYLTKKYPKPFEKIGYIFSIELFRDWYKKLLYKTKLN